MSLKKGFDPFSSKRALTPLATFSYVDLLAVYGSNLDDELLIKLLGVIISDRYFFLLSKVDGSICSCS